MRDVVNELEIHTGVDYLRDEFALIMNKIDDKCPHSAALKRLLSPNTSLDDIFASVCIPVLLTYNSSCVAILGSDDLVQLSQILTRVGGPTTIWQNRSCATSWRFASNR